MVVLGGRPSPGLQLNYYFRTPYPDSALMPATPFFTQAPDTVPTFLHARALSAVYLGGGPLGGGPLGGGPLAGAPCGAPGAPGGGPRGGGPLFIWNVNFAPSTSITDVRIS